MRCDIQSDELTLTATQSDPAGAKALDGGDGRPSRCRLHRTRDDNGSSDGGSSESECLFGESSGHCRLMREVKAATTSTLA